MYIITETLFYLFAKSSSNLCIKPLSNQSKKRYFTMYKILILSVFENLILSLYKLLSNSRDSTWKFKLAHLGSQFCLVELNDLILFLKKNRSWLIRINLSDLSRKLTAAIIIVDKYLSNANHNWNEWIEE